MFSSAAKDSKKQQGVSSRVGIARACTHVRCKCTLYDTRHAARWAGACFTRDSSTLRPQNSAQLCERRFPSVLHSFKPF